jgi:EmrB/QacA subfamily drug resistance transporter
MMAEGTSAGATGLRLSEPAGRWVLAATVAGSASAFLLATVVNVALPDIGRDLGAGIAGRQWIVTGYLLTLSAAILLGGSLGDRLGRRRVYVVGVIWFAVASVLCALAPTLPLLIAARVAQGVGGALLTPGSLAIIQSSFAAADRARAIGAWSALGSIAQLLGPVLGGLIVDLSGWRGVFLLPLPLCAFVAWAALAHVPETRDDTIHGRLDVAGSALSIIALAGVTYAVISAPGQGLTDPRVTVALAAGLVASLAFVAVERRAANPMLPVSIFASRQFTWANVLCFVIYAALGGVSFLLVQQLQIVLGYSGTQAGAAFMPVSIVMFALSERSGALAQRIGPRRPLTAAALVLTVAMVLLGMIDAGDSYVTSVLPAAVVFGLGLAGLVAPVTATTLAAADERHSGVASGVNNAVSRVAQLLAVAALPVLAGLTSDAADIPPDVFSAGFSRAMYLTAALTALGALIAWTRISDDVLAVDGADDEAVGAPAPRHARADGGRQPVDRWCCGVESAPERVPANHPRHGDATG